MDETSTVPASSSEPNSKATPAPAPPPRRRWPGRLLAALLGIVVGLVVTELAFRARDDGAFPHLNCFVADPELGVALEPGAEARIRVATNPPTDVHIGAEGFRGPDLGTPTDDEILVVGDSQVFGLGVEDLETFTAQLGQITERPVINGGVPTYGPLEYTAVVRRVLETRHPRTVVYAINMANDFFEHSRPNSERHAVWDHWAVRRETAPEQVTELPGRDWLFRRSHAVWALRRYLHATDDTIDAVRDVGFPSEGTVHDLVHEGDEIAERHTEADAAHQEAIAQHTALVARLTAERGTAEDRIDTALQDDLEDEVQGADLGDLYGGWEILRAARGAPGDIVSEDSGEESRSIVVTASLLSQARRMRRRWIASATRAGSTSVVAATADLEHATDELARERLREIDEQHVPSVLATRLEEVAALCAEHGAELIVVALPLDVLVSETEFAKYGAEPVDVSASRSLLTDLVETAERLGVRGIDTTDALRAAEPGAFLDGDLHLSVSGHRVVAQAIADRLAAPAPLAHPGGGLPEGRTAIPDPEVFVHEPETTVRGSSDAHCTTHLVREWLRISCRDTARVHPTGVTLVSGGRGEAMTVATETAATLAAPIFRGEGLVADFHWTDRTQRLTVEWPAGAEAPSMAFGDILPPVQPERHVTEDDARLCACHGEVLRYDECETDEYGNAYDCVHTCAELYGAAIPECMAQYREQCPELLQCARGAPEARATCPEGRVHALVTGRCLALCAPEAPGRAAVPCDEGTCTPWQGAHVCVP